MSAGNYIGYFAHLVEKGQMTKEEANRKLKELLEIDMQQDEFDREIFKNCNKAYLHSGSVLTKARCEFSSVEEWKKLGYTDEEAEELSELSKIPVTINIEAIDNIEQNIEHIEQIKRIADEFSRIGCTSFRFTSEELKKILKDNYG